MILGFRTPGPNPGVGYGDLSAKYIDSGSPVSPLAKNQMDTHGKITTNGQVRTSLRDTTYYLVCANDYVINWDRGMR